MNVIGIRFGWWSSWASAALVASMLAACATTPRIDVPANLAAPSGETMVADLYATGVQVYECRATTTPAAGFEWTFIAPEATLADASGRQVGTHGAGPHWQAADGSRVEGVVKARADAPDAGAIPWLLLTTKSVGPAGTFSKVTSVQRIATVRGVAPAGGCDTAHLGVRARVPYTAVYRMFAPA